MTKVWTISMKQFTNLAIFNRGKFVDKIRYSSFVIQN